MTRPSSLMESRKPTNLILNFFAIGQTYPAELKYSKLVVLAVLVLVFASCSCSCCCCCCCSCSCSCSCCCCCCSCSCCCCSCSCSCCCCCSCSCSCYCYLCCSCLFLLLLLLLFLFLFLFLLLLLLLLFLLSFCPRPFPTLQPPKLICCSPRTHQRPGYPHPRRPPPPESTCKSASDTAGSELKYMPRVGGRGGSP